MTTAPSPVALCAALSDETRWDILCRLGEQTMSASELAQHMPVSRQAIAHHLDLLARVGLVESAREGRQLRYRPLGRRLARLAGDLDAIARGWDRRLEQLRTVAEARTTDSSGVGGGRPSNHA